MPSVHCRPVPGSTGGSPATSSDWESEPISKQSPLSLVWTAVRRLLPQNARSNLGQTPGLQINLWPSTFPFMTQPFLMKGFTVWGAGGYKIRKKEQQREAVEIKSLKSSAKVAVLGCCYFVVAGREISTERIIIVRKLIFVYTTQTGPSHLIGISEKSKSSE